MSNIVLNKDFFYRRIKRLYASWKEPVFSHDDSLQKTWLLGYELIDTITVLCEKSIFFLTSKKKVDFLKLIERDGEEGIPSVKLLVREKNDNDKVNFGKLWEAIKASNDGKTLGVFSKNNFPGEFCVSWRAFSKDKSFDTVGISVPIAQKHYTLLLNLEELLLKVMIPGKKLSEVFDVGMVYAKKKDLNLRRSILPAGSSSGRIRS
ncbi:FACT complex subunit spt16-like [Ochlerotatus camptorhynchus]|uniref:FACT complex subunit spt16-like n=1 Tax=Ochlerotatus camptorhynchus TaxID=644619 RepID=UPI0031D158C3